MAWPTSGAATGSPVQILATCAAGAGHNIVGIHIYVDDADTWSQAYNQNSVDIAPVISMSQGPHNVVVQAWDDSSPQNIYQAPVSITVVAGGCSVSSPANGSTVSSPLTINGSCTASAGHNIVGVHIYVDGADSWSQAFNSNSVSFSPALNLTAGPHKITVQAWDDSTAPQVIYKTPFSITVSSGGCTVSSPANGANVVSPVAIDATCTASPGRNIVGIHVYVDDADAWSSGTTNGNAVRVTPSIAMATGQRNVVVQAWDDSNPQIIYKTPLIVNVSQPPQAGCAVAFPQDNATVSSPVPFDATCTATAGHNIVGIHIYVEGANAWVSGTTTGNSVRVTPSVSMSNGPHNVVVQAWDDSNPQVIYKKPLSLNVSPSSGGSAGGDNGDNSQAGFVSTWVAETGSNGANPRFGADANTDPALTGNGNLTGGPNISRVPTSRYLPAGTGKVYAHLMPWFDLSTGSHRHAGYTSTVTSVIDAQIQDMAARGIAGVIADWYGQGSYEDTVMMAWKGEVQKYNAGQLAFQGGKVPTQPFEIAIMEDQGSRNLKGCDSTQGACTAGLVTDLNYIRNTYESQSFYTRNAQGTPIVWMFSVPSQHSSIDWPSVRSQSPGHLFIQESSGGFSAAAAQSDGAFAWVQASETMDPENWGSVYLRDFYSAANGSSRHATGGAWKGFDGRPTSWNHGVIYQHCGATWLNTLAATSTLTRPLETYQLATWNDYEEGTALEPGIDNCLSGITLTAAGSTVSWTPAFTGDGNTNTIDHYTVWARTASDQMINASGPLPVSQTSYDLTRGSGLTTGTTYTIYVKAVGKPSVKNVTSAQGVSYTR